MFASIPFFSVKSRPSGTRFPIAMNSQSTDGFSKAGAWRGGVGTAFSSHPNPHSHPHGSHSGHGGGGSSSYSTGEDGFQVWRTKRKQGGSTNRIIPHATHSSASIMPKEHETKSKSEINSTEYSAPAIAGAGSEPAPMKFSSAAMKTGVDMEDRLLARVKGKINKIGYSTYDATKSFMQQILDSDETSFLDDLMAFVFQKAATESTFCPLYARLLHELADEFNHLRVVMNRLFTDYTIIFSEMDTSPDVGTADYKAFLEAQERKKFRRGYSQFVAELVKYGEADKNAFASLLRQIMSVLEESVKIPERTLTCEEYIDCLSNMCNSASAILSACSWADELKSRIDVLVKITRSDSPGLTNKGRFALMDISDKAKRGWK